MKPIYPALVLVLTLFGIGASAQMPASPHAAPEADTAQLPKQELTGQILYQYLLAEIAAQRGQFALAASAYLDLARNTRDPRIVRRAAEVAFHARQFDAALEAVGLWLSIDPASQQARQMQSSMLLAAGRIDELAALLGKALAAEGPRAGETLMQLARGFSRYPDRVAIFRLFDALTKPYAELPEAQFVRAQMAVGVGDADAAKAAVDRALALRPDWEQAAMAKAELLPRGAPQIAFLNIWLAANPGGQQARLALARALVAEKRYEEARTEFRTLLAANPDNPDILYAVGMLSLQLNAVGDAEQPLRRFVELGRGDLNTARYYLGQIAEQAQKMDEAIRWYDLVDSGENQLGAKIRAARILARQQKVDQARERLAVLRAAGETDVRLTVAEGQLLRDAGRNEEAFDFLNRALEAQPDQTDLLYEVSLAAEKLGQLELVERLLRRLIVLKPDSPQGYNALGYTFADHNIRLDEATQLIDKALALTPDDPFILDSKGWLLFRQGNGGAALEALQKAYSKQPDAEIAAHIGEVLWSLGRSNEAVSVWRDASRLHPGNEVLNATIKRFVP